MPVSPGARARRAPFSRANGKETPSPPRRRRRVLPTQADTAFGTVPPIAEAIAAARSVLSQWNSGSGRPKWP